MPMKYVLTNCNLFVDDIELLGQVEEITVPSPEVKTEEMRLAGMIKPREFHMGYEKLEMTFQMPSLQPSILSKFGLQLGVNQNLLATGELKDFDGVVNAAALHMNGFFRKIDLGSWKPGEKTDVQYEVAVHSFRLNISGEQILAMDDFKVFVGDDEQTAAAREALLTTRP